MGAATSTSVQLGAASDKEVSGAVAALPEDQVQRLKAALVDQPAAEQAPSQEQPAPPPPSFDPIIAAAAQAAAEARQHDKKDEGQTAWKEYNGAKLEAVLRIDEALGDSPVKLVDARFIIEVYKRGGLLRLHLLEDARLHLGHLLL